MGREPADGHRSRRFRSDSCVEAAALRDRGAERPCLEARSQPQDRFTRKVTQEGVRQRIPFFYERIPIVLAIQIDPRNKEILVAANEGDMPRASTVFNEEDLPTYLLLENGMANRVISHKMLMQLKQTKTVTSINRKIYLVY